MRDETTSARRLTDEGRAIGAKWAAECVAGNCPFATAADRELAALILRYEAYIAPLDRLRSAAQDLMAANADLLAWFNDENVPEPDINRGAQALESLRVALAASSQD